MTLIQIALRHNNKNIAFFQECRQNICLLRKVQVENWLGTSGTNGFSVAIKHRYYSTLNFKFHYKLLLHSHIDSIALTFIYENFYSGSSTKLCSTIL